MTSSGVDRTHCSVCGESIGSRKSITAPNGRRVCETCVENARQVLAAREARKHRRAAEAKTQAELARVESDNQIVLELQEDDWLRATANACPNCARYMALSDEACPHCGYGSPAGVRKSSRMRFKVPRGGGAIVRASTGPIDDTLAEVHPRLPVVVPFIALAPALIGLALAWRITWLWNTAVMTMLVIGACVVAACTILLVQQKSQVLLGWLGGALFSLVATVLCMRTANLHFAAGCAALLSLALGILSFLAHRDRLDLALRIALVVLSFLALGVAAYLISKAQ